MSEEARKKTGIRKQGSGKKKGVRTEVGIMRKSGRPEEDRNEEASKQEVRSMRKSIKPEEDRNGEAGWREEGRSEE